MTYAVKADMQAEFGDTELAQLCDRNNGTTLDAAADTVLNASLSRADDEINSYIAQRYTLPFASVPTRLKSVAMDMARFYLYDAKVPEAVKDRYIRAVAWLKDVAAGKASVGVDATSNLIPVGTGLGIAVVTSDAVYTDDLLALT